MAGHVATNCPTQPQLLTQDDDGLGDKWGDDPPLEDKYAEPPDDEYAEGFSQDYCFVSRPLSLTPKQSEEDDVLFLHYSFYPRHARQIDY